MKKVTALIVAFLMAIVAIIYSYLIATGAIKPVLATWLLFAAATAMGMWTYLRANTKKDWVTNIANTTDIGVTWSILIFLLFFGREIRYVFTYFEVLCMVAAAAILLYWRISDKANIANIAINALLVVGYLPTIASLWSADTNTESFLVWIIALVANVIALYNPIKEKDWLATLYASRAVVLVGTILLLMVRIEL